MLGLISITGIGSLGAMILCMVFFVLLCNTSNRYLNPYHRPTIPLMSSLILS